MKRVFLILIILVGLPLSLLAAGEREIEANGYKAVTKEDVSAKADQYARELGFDVEKCEKTIERKKGSWEVEYYNKSGRPGYKRITYWFSQGGRALGMHRSPE